MYSQFIMNGQKNLKLIMKIYFLTLFSRMKLYISHQTQCIFHKQF